MKAFIISKLGEHSIMDTVEKSSIDAKEFLVKIGRAVFCSRNVNTFRGDHLILRYPHISGRENGLRTSAESRGDRQIAIFKTGVTL